MKAIVMAPAKINLTLNMEGVRADGYHLLSSVFQSVSLADTVVVESGGEEGRITLSVSDPAVPSDERNTAYKAAALFMEMIGKCEGVHIEIEKAIPQQAGLGGGSADAAAVLVGLNALFGCPLDVQELCALGERVGADVPFCIVGGTAFVEGIGEIITPMPSMPPCKVLISKPPVGVSTKEAYAAVDRADTVPADQRAMQAAFQSRDVAAIGQRLSNAFEQALDIPDVAAVMEGMRAWSPYGCMMSGSGSAVFALFDNTRQALMCAHSLPLSVSNYLCEPLAHGAKVMMLVP